MCQKSPVSDCHPVPPLTAVDVPVFCFRMSQLEHALLQVGVSSSAEHCVTVPDRTQKLQVASCVCSPKLCAKFSVRSNGHLDQPNFGCLCCSHASPSHFCGMRPRQPAGATIRPGNLFYVHVLFLATGAEQGSAGNCPAFWQRVILRVPVCSKSRPALGPLGPCVG